MRAKRCRSAVATLALVVAACNAIPAPAPTNSAGNIILPTIDTRGFPCAGVGTDAVLAGDAHDPQVAWLIEGTTRVDVVFPYGFSARFAPGLEVIDESGAVVARGGDRIDGACLAGKRNLILYP